jgi:hypothetical protein
MKANCNLQFILHRPGSKEDTISLKVGNRAGFKGERPGRLPEGLHNTEIKSTYIVETFASPRKVYLSF